MTWAPGATFWMILAGLLGMTSKFTECTLGVKYRRVNADGTVSGGPMYYLSQGLAERGMGGAGAGQVIGPGRGVAFQEQAVPFADRLGQPGHWNPGGVALEGLAFLLPGGAGADGLGQPLADGFLAGIPEVDLDIGLAHGRLPSVLCLGLPRMLSRRLP
mgnify:CR=1 FL=1